MLISFLPYLNFIFGNEWLFPFLFVFLITALLYFVGKLKVRFLKWFFFALLIFLLFRSFLRMLFQYLIWGAGPPGSFLLPPYQPISYFFQYIFTHYFLNFLLTAMVAGAAVLFFYLFRKFRDTSERRLWGEGEEYIFLSGAFLVQWPLIIPYLFLGILAATLYFVFLRQILGDGLALLNITPFFAAAAPLVIFLRDTVMLVFFLKPLVMPL